VFDSLDPVGNYKVHIAENLWSYCCTLLCGKYLILIQLFT